MGIDNAGCPVRLNAPVIAVAPATACQSSHSSYNQTYGCDSPRRAVHTRPEGVDPPAEDK